jgi:hypothetical protein
VLLLWFVRGALFLHSIRLVPCSLWKKLVWLKWQAHDLILPCTPLGRDLLRTPLNVATTAQATVLPLVATRAAVGDVIIAIHLRLELSMPPQLGSFLLGNNNISSQPGNHGVGLHHHGLCLRARIPLLSGHALLVLLSNQAF